MFRATLNPQTVRPAGKLRLLNGMANSATQPSSLSLVRTCQMASQSVFSWPLAKVRPSTRAPDGLVAK
jgi:hypothetical protein